MSIAIPTVSSINAVDVASIPSSVSQLAQKAKAFAVVPDVISTLSGAASTKPITYNAAGLLANLPRAADSPQGASGSTTNSATSSSTTGTVAGASSTPTADDLAGLLGFGTAATSFDVLAASTSLQSLAPATAQALAALIARDSNASSADIGTPLTADQARLLAIDLNSATAGLDSTASASSLYDAAGLLQGQPSDAAVTLLNKLLSNEIERATGAGSTTATPVSGTDATLALESLLLANVDLTTAAPQVVSSSTTEATASPSAVSNATASAVAGSASANAASTIAATDAVAINANVEEASSAATTTPAAATATVVGATQTLSTASSNSSLEPTAQAMANIVGNAAYANAVSGLYMSAMIFRAQQSQVPELNAFGNVQPVTAVSNIDNVDRRSTA